MGIPDELDHQKYINALKKIIKISEKHHIPVMIHHATIELSRLSIELGSRFILHGSDSSLLTNAIHQDFSQLKKDKKIMNQGNEATKKPY